MPAAVFVAALAFLIGSSATAEPRWIGNERGAVRLVSAVAATGREGELLVGVEFRLKPGWKTYWRVPGESGIPPRMDWGGSVNVNAATVIWPAPSRFTIAGMQSYGYAGHVILPVRIELAQPGRPAALRLALRYAICREVCVPEEVRLVLDLPAGSALPTPHAQAIADFAARAAKPGERLGWKVERAAFAASGEGAARRVDLVVEVTSQADAFEAPHLIAEGGERQVFGLSSVELGADGRRARFVLPYRRAQGPGAEDTGEIALSLLDGQRAGTFAVRVDGANR